MRQGAIPAIVGGILALLGLVFAGLGIADLTSSTRLLASGKRAEGTIVDLGVSHQAGNLSGSADSVYPTVEFQTSTGQAVGISPLELGGGAGTLRPAALRSDDRGTGTAGGPHQHRRLGNCDEVEDRVGVPCTFGPIPPPCGCSTQRAAQPCTMLESYAARALWRPGRQRSQECDGDQRRSRT